MIASGRRLLGPLLLLAVASCRRAPPAPPARPAAVRQECHCATPPVVERAPTRPGVIDVTGPWQLVGSASTATVTRCAPGYRYTPEGSDFSDESLVLVQGAARVELRAEWSSTTRRGTVHSSARRCEEARGRLEGSTFTLEGQECLQGPAEVHVTGGMPPRPLSTTGRARPRPLAYALALEAGTGHLVGTRNGAPVRLAPVVFVKTGPPCQATAGP